MASAPQRPADFPFEFEHVQVSASDGGVGALVMTPRTATVFGPKRREAVRGSTRVSPVERAILDTVAARPDNTPIMILRGGDDQGNCLWSFDPAFDDAELEETGRVFSQSVMPMYRRLLGRGIVLFVHSDWGPREIGPIRRGLDLMAARLDDDERSAQATLDSWITRNMLLYSSLSLRHVLDKLLPSHVALLWRRAERARRLVEAVPEGTLD